MIDPILPGKLALLYSKSLSGTVECVIESLSFLGSVISRGVISFLSSPGFRRIPESPLPTHA